MTKIFILGLAAISILTFASCETEAPTEKPQNDAVIEGIPTTATIKLANSPSTMATEAGTAGESKISEATLFVFNNADVLESIVKFEAADLNAKKVTFETTTGAKRLFACINMNAEVGGMQFKTVTTAANPGEITTLDQFKKKQQSMTNLAEITADNNFWMTNLEKQPSQVTVTSAAASNEFSVNVGRACAKVSLQVGAGVSGSGGALSDIVYKVKQNPNKMYLMPVYNGNNYTGDQLLTPYYETANAGTYFDGANITLDPATTPKSTYMTENSNQTILPKKATYLEVSGIWTPDLAHTRDADGKPVQTPLAKGTKFWRIAQYDKIATANDKKLIGYKDAFCYNAMPKAALVGTNQAAVEYPAGKCYYAIYVQDKNAGTDKQLPLRYTIKRNSFFKVVISSISGPGSSSEEGVIPDPDKPVEQTINMSVTISVAEWTIADLNAGI